MENQHIGRFTHKVYVYQTKDKYGNIALHKLLPIILDSAGDHAEVLGFAKDGLIEQGYTWVLSRINIVLDTLVSDLKTLYIDTWIQKATSAFSVRLFEVHDGAGTRLAYGKSYWSIINFKTRRITSIKKVIGERNVFVDRDVPCEMPRKLVFEKGKDVAKITAAYADLDYNGHVNSNRYLEWGLNTFLEEFLDTHILSQIEINYTQEVYRDNIVCVFQSTEENVSDIELYNESQEQTACKIRLGFAAKCQTEM